MLDRSHPYRRTRNQYTIEILHIPPDYPLRELENDLKERWGYCIDNVKAIKPGGLATFILYVNFSREKEAIDCVEYLKTSVYITPEMWINEKIREINKTKESDAPHRGMGRGTSKRSRGRGLGRYLDNEPFTVDNNRDVGEPIQLATINIGENFNAPFPPPKQGNLPGLPNREYNIPFPPKLDNIPSSPKREFKSLLQPNQEYNMPPFTLPIQAKFPSTTEQVQDLPTPTRAPEKSDNIVHVGNIPSFVDKDILNDLLLGKQIEGVLDTKVREDRTDPSVNEALIYVSDESTMEGIISKLNHVKVAGKPLVAKQHKKEIRRQIDPQDYISSEIKMENRFPEVPRGEQVTYPPLPPKIAPKRVSQSEDFAQESICMSTQLYDFVKAKFRPQIEAFCSDGGLMQHVAETLTLKSSNPNALRTLHSTITGEVSEQKNIYSEDDYNFLVETRGQTPNLVDEKTSLFMSAGQIRYYLDNSAYSLHMFGIKNCVDVVVNNIQEALYYQFVLKSPMDIYISVFPGIISETIGNSGTLRDTKITIAPKIGIQECKNIREKLKQIQSTLVCEPCNTFPFELITSGLKFCKENNLRVAIIFKDSNGCLYKKYKPETTVTLCGNRAQILSAKQVFSKPISCELAATKNGLKLVKQSANRNPPFYKNLEYEFAVLIQLCPNSVKLQGFVKNDLDRACERIKSKLDSVEMFLSHILEVYQIDFLLEAARNEVHWALDMLSELELNYGVQLINTNRDYKFKGSQEAYQKIENEKQQISNVFKDIILQDCGTVLIDKSSCDFIPKLLEGFIEHHLKNEDIFICYGWDLKEHQIKPSQLQMHIRLVGAKDAVDLIVCKVKAIKPVNGKLRDKYAQSDVQHLDQIQSILKNIEASEFICFKMFPQRIEYHSLGISSKKPWEIFDDIMSDQMVVRSIPIKYETLHFLRSKKLLKNCETEFNCSIIEECQERRARGDRRRSRSDQTDVNALAAKGKNVDVKATIDKLKKWIENFTCRSIDLRLNAKFVQYFFAGELESLKKELESNQLLILDIREVKNKIWRKGAPELEEEISFSVRVEALDGESCDAFADMIEKKLKIVKSEEFRLTDRQLSILMSAIKDQKIPKNEHYYVDVQFKQRRTGSARIVALEHFKEAIEQGMYVTSPYLQFQDQTYVPPKFIREILFHHQNFATCMNENAKTLGVEYSRPKDIKGEYKLSGNRSSIEKMRFNLKNFEIKFVRMCDKMEFDINLPLDQLKKDPKYNPLENDLARNCNVKIFSVGCLPSDIDHEVKRGFGNSQYSDETACFDEDESSNTTFGTYTFGNTTIQVVKGDITKLTVSCIVNGANDRLDHSIGLAKSICDAGGPSVQKGCNNYILENGSLAVGGAVLQGGSNLPCTKIIHVSCPHWDERNQRKCNEDLASCASTALSLCESHKLISVALPGISTGIFGFPPGISTNRIVNECKKYIQANPCTILQRLLFIDMDPAIVKSYYKDCQRAFGLNPLSFKEDSFYPEPNYEQVFENFAQEIPVAESAPGTVEFLWKENDNQFYPYDAHYQNILQNAYKANPQGKATFQRGEYSYTVHFQTLEQVNDVTQVRRKIKIKSQVDPDTIPLPKPPPNPMFGNLDSEDADINCPWYFLNEFNAWVPYQSDVSQKLSDSFLNNPKGNISLEINGFKYVIDFIKMVQTNESTGTFRNVRVDKKKLETAMDELAITTNDKVILYGLQENLPRAKAKFDNFIQNKVFRKQVDIRGVPKTVMIPTIMKLKKKYPYIKIEIKDTAEDYSIKINGFEKEVRIVDDELKNRYIKVLEQVTKQDQASVGVAFPKEWQQHTANEMIKLVALVNGSPEWTTVASQFSKTSSRVISRIERIQNKWLWRKYQQTKDSFKEINQNPNELTVFHGTSHTDPSLICKGSEGFDFRHSSTGMWGKANYFAVNASFCQGYQYVDPTTRLNQIFMVKLLAGNVTHLRSDSSLTMPPLLPHGSSNFVGQRYDTVSGDHSAGSKIYMLYTNERTFPEYLITYS